MLFNNNKEWSRFFDTSIQLVRDMGQSHWFNNIKSSECWDLNKDEERNISWYERKLGEEW
jgi:hypothetical protein